MTLTEQMTEIAKQAKAASREIARLGAEEKNACLHAMADALDRNRAAIQEENAKDVADGESAGLSAALLDRLRLTDARFQGMSDGLREVASLPDPVGRVLDERKHPTGFHLQKVSAPLGVIVIIYESRPNVTADAAALCFKSGNATILRGGKEALRSNQALAKVLTESAKQASPRFPAHAIQVVPTTDRQAIPVLLALEEYIDLCMPRGGEGLIRAVAECSRVPVIKHYKGVCHVYVDGDADPAVAESIVVNSKTQRPGVCNAMETLLIDRRCAPALLPGLGRALAGARVELRADAEALSILRPVVPETKEAQEADWSAEYLDLILSIKVVDGVAEAVQFINEKGSAHSDAIVTRNEAAAKRFLNEVDSAAVYWNVSTRFTDGNQFGMGAEIGISTDKIGARGPMGLEELTTYKWLGVGDGQIRT